MVCCHNATFHPALPVRIDYVRHQMGSVSYKVVAISRTCVPFATVALVEETRIPPHDAASLGLALKNRSTCPRCCASSCLPTYTSRSSLQPWYRSVISHIPLSTVATIPFVISNVPERWLRTAITTLSLTKYVPPSGMAMSPCDRMVS